MEESNQGLKDEIKLDSAGQEEKEPVQEEAPAEAPQEEAEDIEALPSWAKDRLRKAEEERSNLSKAVSRLNKEKKLTLETEEPKAETSEEEVVWDEASKKFQQQTLTEAEKRAERKALETIAKVSEKSAIAKFIQNHPELEDEARWNEVISNYSPKNGKESVDSILRDLDRAYVLSRYERGEFSEAKAEERAKSKVAELSSVSKTTVKADKKSGSALSDSTIRMAERMRVDPKKVALEDDSRYAEIKL